MNYGLTMKRICAVWLAVLVAAGCSPRYSRHLQHGASDGGADHSHLYWRSRYLPGGLVARFAAWGWVSLSGRPGLQLAAAVDSADLFTDSTRLARLILTAHLEGPTDTTITDTLAVARGKFTPRYHLGTVRKSPRENTRSIWPSPNRSAA